MHQVFRFDKGQLVKKATTTDEGFLRADAIVSRSGVFTYVNPDGSLRKELRHPDDVFKADSLESLKMRPITNGHPPQRLVNAKNAKELQVGFTGESVNHDENYIYTSLIVTDTDSINDIKAGTRQELSLGYTVDLIKEDGQWQGQAYTHRQTNIKYNHLALVDRARAGAAARIHLDGAEQVDDMPIPNTLCVSPNDASDDHVLYFDSTLGKTGSIHVGEITGNSVTNLKFHYDKECQSMTDSTSASLNVPASEALNAVLKAKDVKLDELEVKLDALRQENEKLKAERDALTQRLDEAGKVDVQAQILEAVKARVAVLEATKNIMGNKAQDMKLDEMSDAQIRAHVVKEKCPKVNVDAVSEVYIAARFDMLVEAVEKAPSEAMAEQREKITTKLDGAPGDQVAQARARMLERYKNPQIDSVKGAK